MSNAECNIALFIDLENFIGSAVTLGLPIDISKVIIKLREMGNVRIRKAYGDMQRTLLSVRLSGLYHEIRRDFYTNLIEVEDIPYLTPHKNTSDIKLVVEALSVGYQNEYITHFAILASDRDYVPLYQKLRALNKTVITIGVDQMHMNPMVREASDRLFYYEHLFLGDTVSTLYETEEETFALRNEYFELLTRSIKKLERDNIAPAADVLLASMRNARSDFDFALIGCQSFSHFLRLATENGCIEENQQDRTFRSAPLITMLQPHARGGVSDTMNEADVRKEAKIYKDLLSSVLKIPFPCLQKRQAILAAIREVLDRRFGVTINEILNSEPPQPDHDFTLNDISDIVFANLQAKGVDVSRGVVYKILFGLHIARCFYEYRKEVSDITSLEITGVAKFYEVWEEELYKIYIGQIRNNIKSRPVKNTALAQLLYESMDDETLKKIEYLRAS